jgi:hypothetical protein
MTFKKLHIVLLSYHDSNGGAGIAAGRLKVALEKVGHQVDYIVRKSEHFERHKVWKWNRFLA